MKPTYVLYPRTPVQECVEVKGCEPSPKPREGEFVRYARKWEDAAKFLEVNPEFSVSNIPK